ncbi:hypothetical protein ACFV27_43080 [Streptomyces antimycoticus]|uniref:Uncharacterized protein n=1 Tax=Streptomyces mordarskii TaxID=1226758 RepID=A0ABN1D5M6_9ACTN|nr:MULTISPECIES: hypothetical protein [Streptomyces]AJZ85959.1 hypothetical protein AS97_35520 [Streptomyces sp. AgN23]RSS37109.1 hypothetical protein EF902_33640 [Streptomyces sp. WAC05858]WJD99081.1 hypothetical protein QR300_25565 [Streptomyces antimycoticus]WTA82091.1 hypothetical protein OG751_20555 [Streptomyces antimycoticus]WTB07437.1 hypothetical protein OG546_26375 [Streptomyces antimycoticus]
MDDATSLLTAVDRLADRLRALPQSRLRAGAAAEGLALARELSARAQRLEEPGTPPRIMPDAGLFAVADQVAVAGHDLVHALERAPGGFGGGRAAQGVTEAVALVVETAGRCGV